MSYASDINSLLKAKMSQTPRLVAYGQNIAAGSCLGGLTRGLSAAPGGLVLNTQNSENTLVGVGFGLALQGVPAIYFMKQLDFLLLGLDHLVNTANVLRMRKATGSFTAFAIVADAGFEGPQSCLNTFCDFCSIANLPGFTITSAEDAAWIINTQIAAPGFRIVGVSQRMFGSDMLRFGRNAEPGDPTGVFCHADGPDITVASFNFALPQASAVVNCLQNRGKIPSLFGVSGHLAPNFIPILASARQTGRLAIFDDSKSVNRPSDRLVSEARAMGVNVLEWRRHASEAWLPPNADRLDIDPDAVADTICNATTGAE